MSEKESQTKADQSDPNSRASQAFRQSIEANFPRIADSMGNNWSTVSAADRDLIFKPLELKEQIESRKQTAALMAQSRIDSKQDKVNEKMDKLQTVYGLARTEDDAKKLKDAAGLKDKFDRQLSEMIALREKHGGGATFNREDVARGKQLSKDTLLAYKDLAKLGVLSQSDERILNAIIIDDPLGYTLTPGQDSILSNMKAFKSDTEADFRSQLKNRLRDEGSNYKSQTDTFPKTIRKGNQVATVASQKEFEEAQSEGWK